MTTKANPIFMMFTYTASQSILVLLTPYHVLMKFDLGPSPMVRNTILKLSRVPSIPTQFRVRARLIVKSGRLLQFLTHLEISSVCQSTLIDYVTRLLHFCSWCQINQANWANHIQLDMNLVSFFEELFWKEASVSEGSKLMASLKFLYPQLTKTGNLGLPRTTRALLAWQKQRPSAQRVPLPWLCMCAILGFLIHTGRIETALCLLIQFITYMRPGVCDRLTVGQLVAPCAIAVRGYALWGIHLYPAEYLTPGKTGGYDLAVLLDTHLWLNPFLRTLIQGRPPHSPLWPVSGCRIRQDFMMAIQYLKLGCLCPCRYSLRHGGATHDLLSGQRSLIDVKARGHWRSDLSLARYAKPTRALKEMNMVPLSVLEYGQFVEANLEAIFHHRQSAVPPSETLIKSRVPQ